MSWIFVVISDWRRKRLTSLEVIFVSCKSFTFLLKKRKKFKVFYFFCMMDKHISTLHKICLLFTITRVVFNILEFFLQSSSELLFLSSWIRIDLFKRL